MNLSLFSTGDDVFVNCECIKGYTFKMTAPRGKYALLAGNYDDLQDKSVHLTVLNASCHIHTS